MDLIEAGAQRPCEFDRVVVRPEVNEEKRGSSSSM
jgi:hypothetical protein